MATVTVFNRYDATPTDTRYYATVIEGVKLQVDKAAAVSTSGLKDVDAMWCSIPYTPTDSGITINGTFHLSPKEWSAQTGDAMEQSLTFDEGRDILMDGEWDGPKVVYDSDYIRVGFLGYLRSRFDGVYLINSASRYDLIPHFEIGGA
jgi:hypothetical protein